mgnify:CR=1 FL=1
MSAKIDDILAAARHHCDEVIRPGVDGWNATRKWPRAASDKAAALGLLGLYAPAEWGGQGLSLGDGIRVYEELGKGDGAYAFALSMHNICTFAVCGFGAGVASKLANFCVTSSTTRL